MTMKELIFFTMRVHFNPDTIYFLEELYGWILLLLQEFHLFNIPCGHGHKSLKALCKEKQEEEEACIHLQPQLLVLLTQVMSMV